MSTRETAIFYVVWTLLDCLTTVLREATQHGLHWEFCLIFTLEEDTIMSSRITSFNNTHTDAQWWFDLNEHVSWKLMYLNTELSVAINVRGKLDGLALLGKVCQWRQTNPGLHFALCL